jgi:hypothetical protein
MNNDLISRSALLEKMSELNGWDEYNEGVGACHRLVDFAPAVDAEPVRHGIWTSIADGDMAECSECGECYDTETEGVIEFSKFYRFCPSCGAKMDGGK